MFRPAALPSALPDPQIRPEFYEGVATKRFLAWLIDVLVVAVMTGLVVLMTLFLGLFILPVIWLVLDASYRTLTLSKHSATWGHRMMGLQYRDASGARLGFEQALMVTGGYLLSIAFILPQVLSVLAVLFSAKGQNLTDMVLGTAALNRPADHYDR